MSKLVLSKTRINGCKINKKNKIHRMIIFFGASDDQEQTIRCLSILAKLNLK